ncbi:hypothetical protein E0765_07305 [Sulfuricurvum sp. IAE1]|uniref:hypothetical protein n=1 Tax=Sulfuricurvum sp. IAE1 TaxID=2546102 RepID=UPI001053C221|nr:hypothetical protein [Sulfuricurvum sp. IAE1]TDA63634.1 hypothetical protein E0765_07305 [Sulfuricurvum sp. IAE1]
MVKAFAVTLLPIILLGGTYRIAEPDVLSEVQNRQNRAVKEIERQSKREIDEIKKLKGEPLARAQKTFSYYVDPTYTLLEDIPRVDRNGNKIGVLYPKGYRFNPLDYIRIAPPPIIAFNACDKKEVELVKRLSSGRPDVMYASSGCEVEDFPKNIDRKLYLVTDEMKDRFDLKYTVSVVSVDMKAKRIKVEVYKTGN